MTVVQTLIVAILSGGVVSAVLTFINARRSTRTDYMETVANTLTGDYTRLKGELKEVRQELLDERVARRSIERDLEIERHRTHELQRDLIRARERAELLEARVSVLEATIDKREEGP